MASYHSRQNRVLGFQEYITSGYPITQFVRNNTARRDVSISNAAEADELATKEALYRDDVREAQIEFERKTTVGAIAKPKTNTLLGYKWMLRENFGINNIEFSKHNFAFDNIITEKFGHDDIGNPNNAAFNKEHPHYADFAPMRRNLALLRNYLLVQEFPDGKINTDPTSKEGKVDIAKIEKLNEMANQLGGALAEQYNTAPSFISRWVTTVGHLVKGEDLSTPYQNEFMKAANVPDKGALIMYDYLLDLQKNPDLGDRLRHNSPAKWDLLPREETPFSDKNMALYTRSRMMIRVVDVFENNVMEDLRSPQTMSVKDKTTSVEAARHILEGLRRMIANPDEKTLLTQFTDEDHDKARQILKVGMGFRDTLAKIETAEPGALQQNEIIAHAYEAFEKLGFRMKTDAYKMLIEEHEPTAAMHVKNAIDQTPEHYKSGESNEVLMKQLDAGLREAARLEQRVSYDNTKWTRRVSANDTSYTQGQRL